ncbi:hypothetical protein QWZ04_22565 [Vibrio tapetis subsp. quintayensis]|uniref:hypothetical protein n=1 Tax=Vibrio tapetis TaxID=52443 RepID=UPI0025B537FF|nr:hypothetical protein [Vibrio tapetis]MDN3683094.1 hypothetical protein [Vibrio tapetis subsp. quintayensis]
MVKITAHRRRQIVLSFSRASDYGINDFDNPTNGTVKHQATGHGPQGDSIRIDNMVRCVAGGDVDLVEAQPSSERTKFEFTLTVDETGALGGKQSISNDS